MPRMTARRLSSGYEACRGRHLPSRRAHAYRVTRGAAGAGGRDASCRPVTWAEAVASVRRLGIPRADRRGPRRPLRRRRRARRAVSTVRPQPGGTSPGARSASGASTKSRSSASGCGTTSSFAAALGSNVGVQRASLGRALERRARPADRQAGRDRARADPSAVVGAVRSRARDVFSEVEQRERAGAARVRPARHVERDDRVAELGLVGHAHGIRRIQPGDAADPGTRRARRAHGRRRPAWRSTSPTLAPRPMYARTRCLVTVPPVVPADRLDRHDPPPGQPFASSIRSRVRHPVRSSAGSPRPGCALAARHRRRRSARRVPTDVAIRQRPARRYTVRCDGSGASSRRAAGRARGPRVRRRSRWPRAATIGTCVAAAERRRALRSPTTGSPRMSWRSPASRRFPGSRTSRATTRCRAGSRRSPGYRVARPRGRWRLAIDIDGPLDLRAARAIAGGPPGVDLGVVRERDSPPCASVAADRRAELVVTGRVSARTLAWLERRVAGADPRDRRGARPARGDPAGARMTIRARPEAIGTRPTRGRCWALISTRPDPGAWASLLGPTRGRRDRRQPRPPGPPARSRRSRPGPQPEDRFASDLLLAERVRDPWLRELTAAARDAPIPILLGGHSLVGPGVRLAAGPPQDRAARCAWS